LADAGSYQLVVSNTFGVVTSAVAQLVIHCVDVAGANPVAPYVTWATAATNIQDAVTASVVGDVVLVTNGLYAVGGKSMDGVITNRVSVDKAITVQSVNGSATTIIQGAWDPTSTNGPGAVRCVWMTNGAVLSGFTLLGGATRAAANPSNDSENGGGAWAGSTNAIVASCVLTLNSAGNFGGGAYTVTLNSCLLKANSTTGGGSSASSGSGAGAYSCNLRNCTVTGNVAGGIYPSGGGVANCNLRNCVITKNQAINSGGGAYHGKLVNCTITGNSVSYSGGIGGGVDSATSLTNCIVYGNTIINGSTSNINNSTCSYCCTLPAISGVGNMATNPMLLADGVHLASTSPCIAAGTAAVISSTDIDGQPWNNPPSIGCDEWYPTPVIAAQPRFQAGSPAHGLTLNVIAAGQTPFTFLWSKDGALMQDDGHHSSSATANLVVNNFGLDDAGNYQVIVSNAFGVVTGAVAQVVIHAVAVVGVNPVPPFTTWANAATNIQDAINISAAGDIVLVTNGVYDTGGKIEAGDLTNRVAVDKPITVISVNGYAVTVIQGAWDPATTNGPLAVRCAWLADGAMLNGFTLQNGATRPFSGFVGAPAESGGGVWCTSTNGIVSNCLLTNNSAVYGGGISYGTLNNSFVILNMATFGGAGFYATLNNCTVVYNFITTPFSTRGGGTYDGVTRNSIVLNNSDGRFGVGVDNYAAATGLPGQAQYSYSCTSPTKSGTGNINADPEFLDWFHIASTSLCRSAGSVLNASGADLDGEVWASPPSMGCDEVVVSNLVGPLSVSILAFQSNLLVNRSASFYGFVTGRAANVTWSFGEGVLSTNFGSGAYHQFTNSGNFTVTFTAYNNDHPAGVSTNVLIHVLPLNAPQLQSALLLTNGFRFQFTGQLNANYTVQYATNLAPPATWQTMQNIFSSNGGVHQITDATAPSGTRFYRVLAQ
jgi:hypothetical protein